VGLLLGENPTQQQAQSRQALDAVEAGERAVKHPEAGHHRRRGLAGDKVDASSDRNNPGLNEERENHGQAEHHPGDREADAIAGCLPPEQKHKQDPEEDLCPAVGAEQGAIDFRGEVPEHDAGLVRAERLHGPAEFGTRLAQHSVDGTEAPRGHKPHGECYTDPEAENRYRKGSSSSHEE